MQLALGAHGGVDADLQLVGVDAADPGAGVEEPAQQLAAAVPDLEDPRRRQAARQAAVGQGQPGPVERGLAAVGVVAVTRRRRAEVAVQVAAAGAAQQRAAPRSGRGWSGPRQTSQASGWSIGYLSVTTGGSVAGGQVTKSTRKPAAAPRRRGHGG
ncbi:hypothetical protein [Barrientosiimonas endolithica]|uniref:hypothetical protein n=1 Tax=Barrientosiimonas endolithica TaxID=1535208 RepID=UPI00259B665D|nr:hypothetical protein [Barrientosiimonas endolithica]